MLCIEMNLRELSSEALAKEIGVSQVCVNQWRRGRWLPKVPQALRIARLFGRSVESLFPDFMTEPTPQKPTETPKDYRAEYQNYVLQCTRQPPMPYEMFAEGRRLFDALPPEDKI